MRAAIEHAMAESIVTRSARWALPTPPIPVRNHHRAPSLPDGVRLIGLGEIFDAQFAETGSVRIVGGTNSSSEGRPSEPRH